MVMFSFMTFLQTSTIPCSSTPTKRILSLHAWKKEKPWKDKQQETTPPLPQKIQKSLRQGSFLLSPDCSDPGQTEGKNLRLIPRLEESGTNDGSGKILELKQIQLMLSTKERGEWLKPLKIDFQGQVSTLTMKMKIMMTNFFYVCMKGQKYFWL